MLASEQQQSIDRAGSLRVWEGAGDRAPHKPLLLLWALGHYSRGGARLIPYAEVDAPLRNLLVEFGPPRTVHHTEYPFWYLQNDGLWEVDISQSERVRIDEAGYPTKGGLLRGTAMGGVPEKLYRWVSSDPRFLAELTHELLEPAFPASISEDVLAAVGLNPNGARPRRDPSFRQRILQAYEYRCAVCGFDARLGAVQAGLEAAHIMWHQAGGPDTESNGLALCTLHHKLLDLGGMTLSTEGKMFVSQKLHGTGSFTDFVLAFHGRTVRAPISPEYRPDPEHIEWHWRQVFHGPPRP